MRWTATRAQDRNCNQLHSNSNSSKGSGPARAYRYTLALPHGIGHPDVKLRVWGHLSDQEGWAQGVGCT